MSQGRALYLEPGVSWRVTLDDGVALRIEAPGQARSLYPLHRLSRVQSGVQALWTTQALLGCLRAGVTVVFCDARGAVHGWCFGPRRREHRLAQLLREAVRDPEWPQFWGAWQQQVGRKEAKRLRARMQFHGLAHTDLSKLHVMAVNRMRSRWACAPGPWVRALQKAQRTLSAQVCADLVGDPELLCYARPGLNLPHSLSDLMQLRLDAALLEWPVKAVIQQAPGRVAAQIIEKHDGEFYRAVAEMLGDLEHVLREWVS